MKPRHLVALLVCLLLPWGAVARAQNDAQFDVLYGPLRVAEMHVSHSVTSRSYEARVRLRSLGVLDLFQNVQVEGHVVGQRRTEALHPRQFEADVRAGSRVSVVEMRYRRGVPHLVSRQPPEPDEIWTLDAAQQAGLPDPLSVLLPLLQASSAETLCGRAQVFFDGRHTVRLSVRRPVVRGREAICTGRYERLAGYSPDQMRRRTGYDFTLSYQQRDDGVWHLITARTQTILGALRLRRVE